MWRLFLRFWSIDNKFPSMKYKVNLTKYSFLYSQIFMNVEGLIRIWYISIFKTVHYISFIMQIVQVSALSLLMQKMQGKRKLSDRYLTWVVLVKKIRLMYRCKRFLFFAICPTHDSDVPMSQRRLVFLLFENSVFPSVTINCCLLMRINWTYFMSCVTKIGNFLHNC